MPVCYVSSPRCPSTNELIGKGGSVVISVPNDDEFYIGKVRVEASQINNRIMKLFRNEALSDRVVFIKGAPKVRFRTLSLIVRQVRSLPGVCWRQQSLKLRTTSRMKGKQ